MALIPISIALLSSVASYVILAGMKATMNNIVSEINAYNDIITLCCAVHNCAPAVTESTITYVDDVMMPSLVELLGSYSP